MLKVAETVDRFVWNYKPGRLCDRVLFFRAQLSDGWSGRMNDHCEMIYNQYRSVSWEVFSSVITLFR